MKYQLVFQFRGDSLEDYDVMIALEDELIETLRMNSDPPDTRDENSLR